MTPTVPYRDPSLTVEERIEDLLGRMTLPEKVGQMLQLNAQGDLDDIVVDQAGRLDPARLARGDGPGHRAGGRGPGWASRC